MSGEKPRVATPSRRVVLKGLGLGTVGVVVAGAGLLTYRIHDTAALQTGEGDAYEAWGQWRESPGPLGAVAAAVLAANPHNTQPWIFEVSDDSISLRADVGRAVGTVDPYRREQHIGLGCALENLALACKARGLKPTIDAMPDPSDPDLVARVELSGGEIEENPLYDAIGDRHTNRGPYQSRAVPADVISTLVDQSGLPGVDVQWVTEPTQMDALGTLLVDAATAVTTDEQQSKDSFIWFRSNDDAVQNYRDGLTLDAQGMSSLKLTAAKVLPASSRGAGDSFWLDQTRNVHTATAAAYGVLTSPVPYDRSTQLATGRLLQRIHLTATTRGVAMQHMNQITERIDRELSTGVHATFGARFAELLPTGAQPMVTFRIGYADREALESPRRALSAVTR